jgi:hypothetical protein
LQLWLWGSLGDGKHQRPRPNWASTGWHPGIWVSLPVPAARAGQ